MSRLIDRRLAAEAFAWADSLALPADTVALPLAGAGGRILARDIVAPHDLPGQRMAATDGFAVRSSDTVGAGDYCPQYLNLRPPGRRLDAAEAIAVSNGESLPEGADAVLPLELAEHSGPSLEVVNALVAGDWVAETGEQGRAGELLLAAGRCLRPQDLALLAWCGMETVPTWRQPAVKILLAGHYEREVDGLMLASLVARDGGQLGETRRVADRSSLIDALRCPAADLILVAGATGEAATDHAVASLEEAGRLVMHRVAIHPGGNVALGQAGAAAVLLLPGTPLACFAAYELLGARVLRRLARLPGVLPYKSCKLPLASKLTSSIGRLDLCRVRLQEGRVHPLAVTDERKLTTVVKADGFVVVPETSEGYGRGCEVLVYLYD